MKYRKKPVEVEAFRWTGDQNQEEDPEWVVEKMRAGDIFFSKDGTDGVEMHIRTLEGTMVANRGDYIIKGVAGEVYPCKPEIFAETYNKVEE